MDKAGTAATSRRLLRNSVAPAERESLSRADPSVEGDRVRGSVKDMDGADETVEGDDSSF